VIAVASARLTEPTIGVPVAFAGERLGEVACALALGGQVAAGSSSGARPGEFRDKKKKTFFWLEKLFMTPGMMTGPPML
jgi:hypothetical protein